MQEEGIDPIALFAQESSSAPGKVTVRQIAEVCNILCGERPPEVTSPFLDTSVVTPAIEQSTGILSPFGRQKIRKPPANADQCPFAVAA